MRASGKRISFILVALVLVIVGVAGCGGMAAEQRIVCLAPDCVETIYALGLEDDLVGWSQYTDYPPEVTETQGWVPYSDYEYVDVDSELAKDVAVVSGFMDYNKEVIAALDPTLIIASESIQSEMADELKAAGYNVLHHNPTTLDEVFQSIIDIGEATGTQNKANRLVKEYTSEIDEIRTITDNLPKVTAYLEISHYGPWATGAGSPMDQIIEIAGGENIFADTQASAFETTNAEVVARNPDVILSPMWPDADPSEVTTISEIVSREGYQSISAVANDRVYHYDSSLFKRPGPRQITAIRKLAYLLHPYYFDNPEDSVSPWELGRIDVEYEPPEPQR